MHQDFEPRLSLEKRPVVPRGVKDDADLEVQEIAEDAARERIANREHVWREAKLKVHRGDQAAFAAKGQDSARIGEIASHRLLNQDGGVGRHLLHDTGYLRWRDGEIEHRAVKAERILDRFERPRQPEAAKRFDRRIAVDVEDAGDGEAEARIDGKMRVADDAAGADDDDRARPPGNRPSLVERIQRLVPRCHRTMERC